MREVQTLVSKSTRDLNQLKDLLQNLVNQKKDISIRLQLNDNEWMDHFASVLVFSKHAILLMHMPTSTVVHIPDLKQVSGFELDQPCEQFIPFHRYFIRPHKQTIDTNDGLLYA
ncbi:MAG: hypothetical protein WD824_26535 [Cyclobacteriaceae bacterium]